MKSPIYASDKKERAELLEADRNSPVALEQRLTRAEEMLTKSLNLIAAMQPVCTAAERFMGSVMPDDRYIHDLGLAVISYQAHIKANATVQSQARRPADYRGSQGEAHQALAPHVAVGAAGS